MATNLAQPKIGDPRQHTPIELIANADGTTTKRIRAQRCCNGCGEELGDADDRDVDQRGNLTDVRSECPRCTVGGAA